jgi:hypothetical protein
MGLSDRMGFPDGRSDGLPRPSLGRALPPNPFSEPLSRRPSAPLGPSDLRSDGFVPPLMGRCFGEEAVDVFGFAGRLLGFMKKCLSGGDRGPEFGPLLYLG